MGSYAAMVEIARNGTLLSRIIACAADEGVDSPDTWAVNHMWEIAATPGWADDWNYAKDTATVNSNPDLGARDDVIGDAKILSAVQTLNVSA